MRRGREDEQREFLPDEAVLEELKCTFGADRPAME